MGVKGEREREREREKSNNVARCLVEGKHASRQSLPHLTTCLYPSKSIVSSPALCSCASRSP